MQELMSKNAVQTCASLIGIQVVYDLSESPGSRVVSLKVLCTECRVPVYEPLQLEKTYKVLLPSFLAGGGDGYHMLKGSSNNHSSGMYKLFLVICNMAHRMYIGINDPVGDHSPMSVENAAIRQAFIYSSCNRKYLTQVGFGVHPKVENGKSKRIYIFLSLKQK